MTCLLRGPDQGSHGNWQAQHPSSTGAVHCNIRKRTYSQTLLTAVCMFEHAIRSIKHISMALYRFQKSCWVYLHRTDCQKPAHQKLRPPAVGFGQSILAARAFQVEICAADEQGKQYSLALGSFSCAGSFSRCQHCPSTSPSRPPGRSPQHLPSPSTIPYLLHAQRLTLPNPLHSQHPQEKTTRSAQGLQ